MPDTTGMEYHHAIPLSLFSHANMIIDSNNTTSYSK
jgi:hypothetical protein